MDADKVRQERIGVWAQVRQVIALADELFREGKRLRAEQEQKDEGESEDARAADGKGPPAAYSRRRQELRAALTGNLEAVLKGQLGELQAGHCLVPLVIAIDEHERLVLGPAAKRWSLPRLQVELLDIDDGGDRFYDELDARLKASGVHPLVFELYLFCLKWGFEGRYKDRSAEREVVVQRLCERVRREDPRLALAASGSLADVALDVAAGPRRKVGFVAFPLRYYVGAACLVAALFSILRVRSEAAVRRSPIGCACAASADEGPGEGGCVGLDAH